MEDKHKKFLLASGSVFLTVSSLLVLVVGLGLVISRGFLSPNPGYGQNVITVNGVGEAYAVPDVATFSFTTSAEGEDLAAAQNEVSNKTQNVLDQLLALEIPEEDIQTSSINSFPKYEWQAPRTFCTEFSCPQGKQVLVGYQMSQTIAVKVRNLEKSSEVLNVLGSKDIESFTGPNFEVDDDGAVKDEARSLAIADAKAKAEKMADDLGVRLGKVVGFYENDMGYPVYPMMDMAYGSVSRAEGAAPVPAGENKITSNVSITYQIR